MKCKLRQQDLDRLRVADDPASHFLMRLITLWRSENHDDLPTLHDPLAVAVVFKPSLVETETGRVEMDGAITAFTPAADSSTKAARQVDVNAFLDCSSTA